MKIFIETYGCSNNIAESQIMAGILSRSGYDIVKDEKIADIIIINTCSVKSVTEQKILHRIKKLRGKKLIIAGCMPESEYDIVKSATNASLVSTNNITEIAKAVAAELEDRHVEILGKNKKEKLCLPKIRESRVIEIVPICSGCSSYCTYCSTKLAKGELFSYDENKIITEIKKAKAVGYKEFWLTGQDCGCYGFDKETNLANLIKNITNEIKGKYFLRVGMINPEHLKKFTDDLIGAYKNEHVFKFLHLPIQSGSNKVLKQMGRNYTKEDFFAIIDKFREEIPEITIWTDIIVGFPSETQKDFEETVDLLKHIKPDFVNVSAFASRPGTKASNMKKIPTEIVKERTRIASEIVDELSLEQNKKHIGKKYEVIIDEYNPKNNNFIGRNISYKPVVVKNTKIGDIVNVNIVDAGHTHITGALQ
jgi:MiaB-like tRNA modifying enzyme